jgi:hypothetical protein
MKEETTEQIEDWDVNLEEIEAKDPARARFIRGYLHKSEI